MEEAIISNASAQKYSPNFPRNTSNCSEIVVNILKERVSFLENEIKKNVIDFLMKKLVIGNNRQMFNDVFLLIILSLMLMILLSVIMIV